MPPNTGWPNCHIWQIDWPMLGGNHLYPPSFWSGLWFPDGIFVPLKELSQNVATFFLPYVSFKPTVCGINS